MSPILYVLSSTMTTHVMESWTSLYNFPTKDNVHSAICCISFRWTLSRKTSSPLSQNGRRDFISLRHCSSLGPQQKGTVIPLYHQGCIAINTRGATIYGARRTLVRRMILHVQHHEDHLLTVLADAVPARKFATNMDPLEAFLQTRPFPGSLLRRAGFWTVTDRAACTPCGSTVNGTNASPTPCRAHTPPD